jgi:signal transduction histidine kinase
MHAADPYGWFSPELRRVENERGSLAEKLAALPQVLDPQFTERLGYHSGYSPSADTVEWVEMDLHRDEALDAVVLVPATSNAGSSAAPGYGFPVRFRVEISGSADHADRTVIVDHTDADFPNPGGLPVYLPCAGKQARFVRLTATRLFREGDRALLALGEMILLQGQRNLAWRIGRADFTYSRTMGALPVWGLSNLVDGHSVLGPPEGAQASPSLGFSCRRVNLAKEPHPAPRWVQVDLGSEMPVDEVRLFPAHPPEYAHRPGYGFPPTLKVELSNAPDFLEPVEMSAFRDGSGAIQREPVNPGDNFVAFTAHDETARYVRVTATRLFDSGVLIFALGEMQVWSGDRNVALDRPVTASDSIEEKGWSRAALVDGFTSRANILDWPQWLAGLSQRRELQQQVAVLAVREALLTARLRQIGWWGLAGLVAMALLALLGFNLRQRRERRRELEALRQRISQDLHDEIGSSLGSITFISDDALALTKDEALRRELGEIRETAQQALDSMRDIVRLAQSGTYGHGDLTAHLREIAERMLRSVPHVWHAEAGADFDRLSMAAHRDLVLMFKETLHNLARHARATQTQITLARRDDTLSLTVRDNGCGFDPATHHGGGMGLTNLERRAAKHGGHVRVTSAPGEGTTVCITFPAHG